MTARELAWLTPLYATYSFVQLKLKLAATPAWFDGTLAANHARLLDFTYTNNEQSRLLQYAIPEALHRLFGLGVPDAYLVQRFVFVALAFLVMHVFFRAWFDRVGAALCTTMQAALMALSYQNDLQESAPLLLLMFVIGLWRIREHDDVGYAVAVLVGAMANETCLILAAGRFFYEAGIPPLHRDLPRFVASAKRTLVLTLPAAIHTVAIRVVTAGNPHLGGAWHLPGNIGGLLDALLSNPLTWPERPFIFPWLLFGPLWIYAMRSQVGRRSFLRSASLVIPLFITAHLVTGIFDEVRQLVPLGILVIPMALWGFASGRDQSLSPERSKQASRSD